MTLQARGFLWSAGIHGAILLVALVLQVSAGAMKKVAVIDFTLSGSPAASEAEPARREPEPVQPRRMPQKAIARAKNAEPPSQALSLKEATPADPPREATFSDASEQGAPSDPAHAGKAAAATGSPGDTGPGETREKMQALYLKEHFVYIRDRIVKAISYPAMARKMGWHGQVKIAFVVCEDGGVRDVRVVDSSGHGLLDRNAVDTVKQVAPFPRPPVLAEIRMAISYRLQ